MYCFVLKLFHNVLVLPVECLIFSVPCYVQVTNKKGDVESSAALVIRKKDVASDSPVDALSESPVSDAVGSESETPVCSTPDMSDTSRRSSRRSSMMSELSEMSEDETGKKKKKKDKPAEISKELKDQKVTKGSDVKFTCKVKGRPTPEVKWQFNGVDIEESDLYMLSCDGEKYSLLIENVQLECMGKYTCKVNL